LGTVAPAVCGYRLPRARNDSCMLRWRHGLTLRSTLRSPSRRTRAPFSSVAHCVNAIVATVCGVGRVPAGCSLLTELNGFFSLRTPLDLREKLEVDFARLIVCDPISKEAQYAAFDFFVTVSHLPDWLHPSDESQRKALFAKHVELRVARHIANGSKHFEATHAQNRQVAGTSVEPALFQRRVFQASVFQTGGLIVALDSRDPDTATIGQRIEVVSLAERVFGVARAVVV